MIVWGFVEDEDFEDTKARLLALPGAGGRPASGPQRPHRGAGFGPEQSAVNGLERLAEQLAALT
ncbi:MAG: hypothetical protein ACRD0K_17225 [Egibacteraceae bacterium]